MSSEEKRKCIVQNDGFDICLVRRCELIGLPRSSFYYKCTPVSLETEELMRLLDQHYTEYPFVGKIKRAKWLSSQVNFPAGKKRVATLMQKMGLQTLYPKPNTSVPNNEHMIYRYLLKNVDITAPNQVWSSDITYIPLLGSHIYLMAIMDWYSRFVIDWELSITLEADFCVTALRRALEASCCDIFNTDQGSQFTCQDWINELKKANISISMDGRGRYLAHL